ncbi:MAG: amidase family protein [Paracoccus sp. (in: a-proteobacteria)]|uniref:amidase n=1 Tax=Paracoccus sp. TaxID=267 RepID=UPI0026DFE8CC|nr:amidase family protein [Paracoccus sp. (in: a-proteobacteria)]MDO5621475.1 amidase family protein [Paracoccus sp. (in: a-proteobacteria)]
MDWLKAGAVEQGRAIMAGLLDTVSQVEAYLDAIARNPYANRIYTQVLPERARDQAVAAHDRARAGLRRGLLDGVAISWKDNIDMAGQPTEAGSRLLAGRKPVVDAEVLRNAESIGLVSVGKTHMTELAFSGLGLNPMTATPPNALDAALAPGGSSSGAAVSVALGLAAAAIGSDTGGSIRLPSAWNDLVGFKPTHGAVSGKGVVPLAPHFDVAGPLARNVEDCAALFAVLTGDAEVDLRDAVPGGLRLMVLDGVPFDGAREGPVAAFQDAVDRLARAGAAVSHGAPDAVARAMDLSPLLIAPEAYGIWKDQIEAAPELMYDRILTRFRSGGTVLAADHVAAWQALDRARADWAQAVAGFDAVILPTAPILPPDTARLLADEDFFATENLLALRNTRIGNMLGLPAVTIPTGHPGCGLMALGRAGGDRALLRVAAGIEAALRG